MKLQSIISALAMTAATLIACSSDQSKTKAVAGTTPPQGVMSQQNSVDQSVAARIAAAECAHENTCNNVGPNKKYTTVQACQDERRASTFNDLNAYNCPRGIDASALDKCVASYANKDCGLSLQSLVSSDCNMSTMCIK